MKLSEYQISKIEKTIDVSNEKNIVILDVGGDKTVPLSEKTRNIYCVDSHYNIIWQVNEIKTCVPFDNDLFVYLSKNKDGDIVADRFSGFEYKINPETGEAEQIGFHK